MDKFIPVCEPCFLGNEEKYAGEAVRTAWVSSSGAFIKKFEEGFSNYCSAKFGISTTSGTTALHLALIALGVGEGDEVIIPDFTMVAVLSAVLYCRATPVFVDAERDTWNIDVRLIEERITPRTKVIIPVHTYGHPVDMDPLLFLAEQHNIAVVEDAAEAHGAEYRGRKCGSMGVMGCFSFFGNKIITTGEGGMVVTSDVSLADRCRYFKNLCFPMSGPRDFIHDDLGYNYRMTNVQAAIGLAQLERIDELMEKRRANALAYNERLQGVPGVQLPVEKDGCKNVYWMYGIVIDEREFGLSRDALMAELREAKIETRYFFRPLHRQKLLEKFGIVDNRQHPVTEWLSQNGLYLPSSSKLTMDEIEYISDTVRSLAR